MSGICGILALDGKSVSEEKLGKMSIALKKRGPDKETSILEGIVGFAHRLLVISGKSQEVYSGSDGIFLVMDGLLDTVSMANHKSAEYIDGADPDKIVEAYRRHGVDFLNVLEGVYAFALYDSSRRRLFLVRDRMGIKPLYFAVTPSHLIFGSSIKSILSSGYIVPQFECSAFSEYLTFQHTLGDKTFFKGIRTLPPAAYLLCENMKLSAERYWRFSFQEAAFSLEEYICQTRGAFNEVMNYLYTDSAKAAHLSGGLDSSIISMLLARNTKPLRTFSGVYPFGDKYDESCIARKVVEKAGCAHTFVYPSEKDVIALLPDMASDLEELVSDVAFSRYYVANRIKEMEAGSRVVYCGQGADELFGGYAFYQDFLKRRFKGPLFHQAYRRRRLFSRSEIKNLLTPGFFNKLFGSSDVIKEYRSCFGDTGHVLNDAAYADMSFFLPYWLRVEDRINAAFSMEVRYPFLCKPVVDLASRLPEKMKIKGNETKAILREAFKDILPAEVLNHEKIGFRTPASQWFREGLYDYTRELLLSEKTLDRGFLQQQSVRQLLDENKYGKTNSGWQIWTLLLFELWLREWMDRK